MYLARGVIWPPFQEVPILRGITPVSGTFLLAGPSPRWGGPPSKLVLIFSSSQFFLIGFLASVGWDLKSSVSPHGPFLPFQIHTLPSV